MPADPHSHDPLRTVRDLAERLGISLSLAYRLIAQGEFRVVRVGVARGTIRIPESDIDRYLRDNEQ